MSEDSKWTKTALTVFSLWLFAASSAHAATVKDDYPFDLKFEGLDAAQVFGAGQTWSLGAALAGWEVMVRGGFNQSYDIGLNPLGLELFNTNQSAIQYRNLDFPDANGVYIRNMANDLNGSNLTVNFSFTFTNVGSALESLGLALFSGESMDAEQDTLTHSDGRFRLFSSRNLNPTPPAPGSTLEAGVRGNGTGEMAFRESTGLIVQNGDYAVTTGVRSGETITWTYDYLGPTKQRGANMIGISASGFAPPIDPAPIPVPAGLVLLLTGVSGLFGLSRVRARSALRNA